MATFHENLVQSFHNFRDKYLKANGEFFKFGYDSTKQKYGYLIDNEFNEFSKADFVFDTYAEYQAAYSAGDIPVGSVVYIKEGSTDNTITALQVVYNNGTVKSALDKLNSDLNIKGTITRDNNWDNITQGRYNVNTWSGTDTPSNNYPSHRGMGLLEVIGDENNNITQKVMFTNGYFYYRIKNSGTWSEWVLVDTNSPVETLSPTIGAKVTNHITFTRIGHKLILTGYFQVTSDMKQGDVIANFGDTIASTVNQGVMIFGTSGTTGLHPLSFRKTSGGTTLTVGENVSTGYYNISALFIIS